MDDQRGHIQAAGAAIMSKAVKTNDPQTNLYVMDHALSESMYIKDMAAAVAQSRSYMNLQHMLIDLELDRIHPAHKAFLLALIRSGKVNTENLLKV